MDVVDLTAFGVSELLDIGLRESFDAAGVEALPQSGETRAAETWRRAHRSLGEYILAGAWAPSFYVN